MFIDRDYARLMYNESVEDQEVETVETNTDARTAGLNLVKMGLGLVVSHGVRNVIRTHLGYTPSMYDAPFQKMCTSVGVYAISMHVSNAVVDTVNKALDETAESLARVYETMEEMKAKMEKEDE